jgi:hypothetical protein
MAPSTRLDPGALALVLDRQLEVVTRSQALAAGLTRHALQHRLRPGGSWRSLVPGVYLAATGAPTAVQRQMAALLHVGPDSVITGPAALQHHRISGTAGEVVDVLIPATRRRSDAAFVRLHRTTRMPDRILQFGPLRYALPARSVLDTSRAMTSLRDVRAVVAASVQRGACTVLDLAAELSSGPSVGSALFRQALSDVMVGIRSTAEGDLLTLLRKSSLPMPLLNAALYDGATFIASPDAWWPEFGVAVEVDSREWHLSPHDHARTLERQRRMAQHGILVLPFTPKQIRSRPREVIAQIRAALGNAAGRPPVNLRTVPLAA